MKLEWSNELSVGSLKGDPLSLMSLVADCCQIVEGIPLCVAAHVVLTGNEGIRRINREQRGIDGTTDVLSFPTVRYTSGQTAVAALPLLRREFDADINACMLGDIVISVPQAKSQANDYGHSLQRELAYLLAHGMFHLFGYDHLHLADQKEMRKMEEKALQIAGMSRDENFDIPSDDELLALARQAMERAYVPYSRYQVGTALLCESGRVIQGCNVENASFGLSNCAERTAVFKAISEGEQTFTAIAIAAKGMAPYPCGACRQVLSEFASNMRVLITWEDTGEYHVEKATLSELLPYAFLPSGRLSKAVEKEVE